jgi:hypothetical protein
MRNRSLATRLRDAALVAAPILAVYFVTDWLFDDPQDEFFAFMGTIFTLWVVYCVLLPTVRAHRL